jgi:carbamoyltransferase
MRDFINSQVKHREWFRPLAPSVLEGRASDYFELFTDKLPFMLVVSKVKKEKEKEIPSVLHVDGTGRIQTVNSKENGIYYDLIKAFDDLTGTPVVLNTSFNNAGEPIVESPEDAIKTFLTMNLDYLVLGNFLITKENSLNSTKQ